MKRLFCSFALVVACGMSTSISMAIPPANGVNGSGAGGSGSGGNYYPARATVSPYLTLAPGLGFGAGGGAAGINYYTFIRPGQQQQQFNQQQSYMMNHLQQEQNMLLNGQQPIYGQNGLPAIRPTGTKSWFMTQQQYFGVGASGNMTGRAGGSGGGMRSGGSMQVQRPAY